MSGIFGCWHPDGGAPDVDTLRECVAGIDPHGTGRLVRWTEGPITLAFNPSPASPSGAAGVSLTAGTACVFDGRLDNRDELFRIFMHHPLARSGCSDGDLVVAAYERFGDAFVEHLDGDFSIGVFDRRLNRLVLARDRLGLRPLCYTRLDGTFLFASNARAMLAYPGVTAAPDEAMLADFILSFLSRDAETRTFFRDVRSLPPAHVLVVTPGNLSVRRYFDLDTRRQIRLRSWPDYVDAFRERFEASVRNRLRSAAPVAVSVSGGLDSAYILCVAARLVRGAQTDCPAVLGFNYAGLPGTPSDESDFVDALERACRVRIERIPQRCGFMECAADGVWHTESPMVEGLACQAQAGLRRMRDAGAGRLLTGHWGDQILSDSDYLLDLVRSGRWRMLRRHSKGWGIGAPRLALRFARDVASRRLPSSVKFAARRARGGRDAGAWQAPWFTPRFRRILRERATCAPLIRPPGTSHASALYRQSRLGYHVQCMEWNSRMAGAHDLDAAFPFLDCGLIQFLMSIPGDVQSYDGVPRGLMREAMRGVVPAAIVDRRSKGEFTHLTNGSIEHDFAAISELFGPSALSVRFGYIDGPVLRRTLGEWRAAIRTSEHAVLSHRLLDLCGFELLLRRFARPDGDDAASGLGASPSC